MVYGVGYIGLIAIVVDLRLADSAGVKYEYFNGM